MKRVYRRITFRSLYAAAVLAVAVCAFVYFGSAQAPSQVVNFDWPLTRSATKRIALNVPRGYLAFVGGVEVQKLDPSPGFSDPGLQGYLSISTLWPEMTNHTKDNDPEFHVLGGGRMLLIMMTSAATDDFQGRQFNALELHRRIAIDFLENVCVPTGRPMPDNVRCSRRAPTINRQVDGLHLLGRDYAAFPIDMNHSSSVKDIYERRGPDGVLQTLITCNPDGLNDPRFFSPHCNQAFIQPKLNSLVEVDYSKTLLPQWQDIQSRVISLVDSFAQASVKSEMKK